jgi:hypothetical protein
MRTNSSAFSASLRILTASTLLFLAASGLRAQTSAITYQGHLMDAGVSASGNYDIRLTLKNAATAGSNVVAPVATSPVAAVNGLFTLSVDFGSAAFDGSDRWLEVAVRPAGSVGAYTILSPRQKLNASPYALKSLKAGTADSATAATSAGSLTGVLTGANVSAGFISSAMIASGAVGSSQLGNGAVQAAHVGAGAIGNTQLAANAVTADKMRANYRSGSLGDGTLTVATGVMTFSTTYALPFTGQPSVTLPSSWASGSSTQAGFSATTALVPVTVGNIGASEHVTSIRVVNGRPAIAYSALSQLRYARAMDAAGTTWSAHVVVDGASNVGQHCSMEIVNGRPAVSYYDAAAGRLKYVIATNADGTAWSTPVVVDSSANVGQHTSLAVVNDRPAISYYDVTGGNLKFVRATDVDGATWNAPLVVESTGDTGLFTCLRMVNTRPAISYYDQTLGVLKFVRASTVNGTAWDAPVTVDSAADVGRYTSLAIINGMPAISYVRTTGVDLRYVRATNANGGAWGVPLTLDAAGSAGSHGSLDVLGGMPVIFYHDSTNVDLKCICARDADGAVWAAPCVLDAGGSVGKYTSVVVHQGRACVSYTDATNSTVKHLSIPELPWNVRDDTVVPIIVSSVAAGGIGSTQIAAGAVQSANLAAGSVQTANLAAGAVGSQQLAPGAVGFSSLAKPPQAGTLPGTAIDVDYGKADFSVTFPQAYSTSPVVTTSLTSPDAGSLLGYTPVVESVTPTGFTGKVTPVVPPNTPSLNFLPYWTLTKGQLPSLSLVNGKPAIAYHDRVGSTLKAGFLMALDVGGRSWASSTLFYPDSAMYPIALSLAEVGGRPAIAMMFNGDILFCRSNLADGQEQNWPAVELDTLLHLGHPLAERSFVHLMMVDGKPAIVYSHDESVRYIRATNADGTAWGAPVTIAQCDHFYGCSLQLASGHPAIAFYDSDGTHRPTGLYYVRANDALGSSWPAPGMVLASQQVSVFHEMTMIGGHPAICFYDAVGATCYMRATNPEGSSWAAPVQVAAPNTYNSAPYPFTASLCEYQGAPAISYYRASEGKLYYLRANDAAGSSWRTPGVISSGGSEYSYGYHSLRIVNGQPCVSNVFSQLVDATNSRFSHRLEFISPPSLNGASLNWIALPP